jgi:hypothetical protein
MTHPVRTALGVGLLVLGIARAGVAGSFLYVRADPGDLVAPGRVLRLGAPAYGLTATRQADGAVVVSVVLAGEFFAAWELTVAPPRGVPLAPGTYEGARRYPAPEVTQPGLAVGPGFVGCSRIQGRFVVHEVRFGAANEVLELSVDFEQHCEGAVPALRGALRYRAGDGACDGIADGTPCDDHDACSAAACDDGVCVAAAGVVCAQAPDDCHDPAACDPTSAECAGPAAKINGAQCDDNDACTQFETCTDGVCAASFGGTPCFADDNDACTEDFCDSRRGCVHDPIAGACGRPGVPSTVFYARSEGSDPFGAGARQYLTAATAQFIAGTDRDGTFFLDVRGADFEHMWRARFVPPQGLRLAPGTYEPIPFPAQFSPVPGVASLEVARVSGASFCSAGSGRFVVLEATHSPGGSVRGFAADFELRCADTGGSLIGSVRYHAGDAECVELPDGSPCDDRNACTGTSACLAGACVGAAPVTCPGGTDCREEQACNPADGTCVAGTPRFDGPTCSDAARCVPSGTCRAGECESGVAVCDDGDFCTDDACDGGGGCTHAPLAGACWLLRGRVTVIADYQGHSCACALGRRTTTLALLDDGTYRSPSGGIQCNDQLIVLPDETGPVVPGKRGRLDLMPANLQDILAAAGVCSGSLPSPSGYRTWVRPVKNGERLKGLHRESARSGGIRVRLFAPFTGRKISSSVGVSSSGLSTRAAQRCGRELGECLRAALQ